MLNNLPQVTKNILILNIMFFVATLFLKSQGIDLRFQFGAFYINSTLFQPFQIVTHFFMHGGPLHILFNMLLLVMLGAYLERIWGPKRFFIFYIACGLGSFGLYNIIGAFELYELKHELTKTIPINQLDIMLQQLNSNSSFELKELFRTFVSENNVEPTQSISDYIVLSASSVVGASGAIFGIMAAFAILFPNTEFMIYFLFPIKAKYFVGGYFLLELYLAYQDNPGDNTAHLAHIGGAIVGGIIVLIWRKTDKNNFW
jgi:rhomboid-like protein